MFIIQHRNVFFGVTAAVLLLSLVSIFSFGLPAGIEFTGGTLAEIRYEGVRPSATPIVEALNNIGLEGFSLRETGSAEAGGYVLRVQTLPDELRGDLARLFSAEASAATVNQLTEVGPTIGAELRNKSILAVALVLLCILLFIAFAFRKVSTPVSSWIFGSMAIVGLVHNIVVTLGFFALLTYLIGAQVDTLFVTALLTVLGFSVHDTIVVFDRVRENLRINHERGKREAFDVVAGRSLNQTLVRSINTSVTVVISLLALYILGPESTKIFSLTLLVGIVAGTYSSIALATPLLVAWEKYRAKK